MILQVSKVEITDDIYSEPVIIVKVRGNAGNDWSAFENLVMTPDGSQIPYTFTFVPSWSAANQRVFIGQLDQRKSMMDDIINDVYIDAVFSGANSSQAKFSLLGSGNALKNDWLSMKNNCAGGIEIQ